MFLKHLGKNGARRGASKVSAAVRDAVEALEGRLLLAAHIVGSSTVYPTIQAAVNAASAGATITVDAGAYAEEVTVNKSLTIDGAQANVDARLTSRLNGPTSQESVITGATSKGVVSPAFYVAANDVTINGFTVQGETDQTLQISAGIVIAPNFSGAHILYNIVQNNVSGLFVANSSSTDAAVIQYNDFRTNNNPGVNGGRGIYSDQNISGGNLTNVIIDSNTFTNNFGTTSTTGLEAACAFEATVAGEQSNIRITNNVMAGDGKAVLFFNTTTVLFAGNTVSGTLDQYSGSIRFEGNDRNVTIDNNTADNLTGPAVAIDSKGVPGDNSNFVVNFNNFFKNNSAYATKISVVYDASTYDGTFDARYNWWGNISGPSGDGAGTGDAVSAGVMQVGNGLGWSLLPGGSLHYSPWSTALNVAPGLIPSAPVALGCVASGVTQVNLSWIDSAPGVETGFVVQRSTDGVNFTQVGTAAAGANSFVDTTAAGGTSYTYRVAATNSNGTSPFSTVATVSTPAAGSATTNVSSLNWVSATAGYLSPQKNLSINGNPIRLNGVVYPSGIGTHAVSQIVYNLAGNYSNFMSDIGVDSEENGVGTGSVDFQVMGDGKVLYDSGVLTNPAAAISINVNVTGVKTLTLVANNGVDGSINFDHADWAGARLLSSPTLAPAMPSGLTAIATSPTQVNLTWTNNAINATGIVIERSTDGVNFTPIITVTPNATTYSDTTAAGGTTYTYGVAATNANGTSAFTLSPVVTTPAAGAITTYISSLNWVSATAGYGTVQKNKSINGNPITLNGVVYAQGIGTHAASQIVYNLGGAYTNFISDVGIDAEENGVGVGSVDFKVLGDNGAVLFDSGVLTNASPTVTINVNVTGVQTLTLVATNGVAGNINYDHADWAGARLLSSSTQVPVAPTGLAGVAVSPTAVNLSWTNNAPNATGFIIQRSTDGVNFTQIGTTAVAVTTFSDTTAIAGTANIYRVAATNSAGPSLFSPTASITTPAAGAITTYLSSLNWVSATAGYGTVQKNKSINGNPITLNGVVYAQGLGTHAASQIVYNLAGAYTNFISDVGIDSEEIGVGSGSVDFKVLGDNGAVLFDSGVLTSASPTVTMNVNVTGVQTLTLVATNGVAGSIDYDHSDWAGARLLSSSTQVPVAPSGLSGVAISPTAVNLSWTNNAPNATGFVIQRSTDGVNFTQIGTTAVAVTTFSDTTAIAGTANIYRVAATNSAGPSLFSPTASITTPAAGAITTYLSSLNWVSATAGYGTVQKNKSINGNPITLNGVVYAQGLGTHAASQIVYNLAGAYTNFISDVGIDAEEIGVGSGSVDFKVLGDNGAVLFDTGVLTSASPTVTINVNVTGVQTLTLVATNGVAGSIDYDHADWAGARLLSSPLQAPAAPSNLVAVTSSTTQVNLTWTNSAPTATGFIVQRSTDGVNFATIATLASSVTSLFDTTAVAGTSYSYQILATNGSVNSTPSNIATATTLAASAVVTNLSSIPWVSATAGYGTVQVNTSIVGNPITLRGVTYATGIGTHAVSQIVYNLAGGYSNFLSDVGIDGEELGKGIGSVDFQVIGDGKVLFDSGVVTSNSSIVSLDVNVTGVQTLTLLATNGVANSIDFDHADWAGARLVAAASAPAPASLVMEGARPSTISALHIVNIAAPTVPTPWANISVGNVGQLGGASDSAGVFTVAGAGAGIGGTADALEYVFQSLTGSGTIVAHLDTAQTGSDEAGIMIRETTGANAKEVAIAIATHKIQFVHRGKTGGIAGVASKRTPATVPEWVKLTRKGNSFIAYDSVDGIHWKKIGSTTIKMNASVSIGLASASGGATTLNSAVFSDVSILG